MLRFLVIFRVLSPQVVCNLCGPGCHDEGVHCILYVCWGGLFCVYVVNLVFVWLQYKKQKWGVRNSF